ncbi:MAG: DNA-deoxyinosine glycosylase [Puniceicoccales bacterium]|jgi:hypoxanthine-DNA glycosylase|nr:DNA-deoxyinosine glycosylase [Puniceicoccales bacterium]
MFHLAHPFAPIFDEKSSVLILGTFPSVASREQNFYYAHPQNRFWKIIARLTQTEVFPDRIDGKKQMLLENKIALWDVIQSCDIEGSSDHRIANVTPVDLSFLLKNSNVQRIFTNGDKAYKLYQKYLSQNIPIEVSKLPSTSPANAAYGLEKLIHHWNIIGQYLN